MRCTYCGEIEDRVVDSRHGDDGRTIRRRRECLACGRRFTTYEEIEEKPLLVVKRDGRREPFDREKLRGGLLRACEKRPVPVAAVEAMIGEIVAALRTGGERELPARRIGELVMEQLKETDQVAYVRFASVYRQFKDVTEFEREIARLKAGRPPKPAVTVFAGVRTGKGHGQDQADQKT